MRARTSSIRRPLNAALPMALLLLAGVLFSLQAPAAAEARTIAVLVRHPGAGADTMAVEIGPLERRLATISGIASITTLSTAGSSTITIEIEQDSRVDGVALEVRSAILEVPLPKDLPSPPTVVTRGAR